MENGSNAYAAATTSGVSFDHIKQWSAVGQSVSGIFADIKGGIKVNGYDGELIAILMRNGTTMSVSLAKINAGNTPGSSYAESVSGSWSAILTYDNNNVPKMLDGTVYFPLSMAPGDFDKDGFKNEIAVAYSTRAAIGYTVLQITHTGSTSQDADFSVSVMKADIAYKYKYNSYYEHQKRG